MAPEYIRIFTNFAPVIFESIITIASQQIRALHHRLTYHASSDARNVVVIGGSFAGLQLAKRLSQTLPSGFRVVVVERNSHFNFAFNFPRYSVVGEERMAFIPYNDVFRGTPEGSWVLLRDTVTHVTDGELLLQSGQKLPFDYLAIATGLQQPLPAKTLSPHKDEACADLRSLRMKIQRAVRITIVGGGAVGVQLAADIKSAFPAKEVALIHSRERVLNSFGKRLSNFVEAKLDEMGIKVMLKERPHMQSMHIGAGAVYGGIQNGVALVFQDGSEKEFDLVIPCVGATPNTKFLSSFVPSNFSRTTGRILVRRTLQLADDAHLNIFALGDVAETEGPKMGRTAMAQAELVCKNILALIKGTKLRPYEPKAIDGMLNLTLGLVGF
ncbi:unnamed protein product [Penicillium egyptiacum]|uniref:FAD/NAD(P)-binding domain-containing protein n=1 Tax=Penicillium egyptiacum TaxID=1303716 RepID=A0A9W4K9C6_9EURO|nr:unnamed protein product [Penicillium egyptiacum]